MNSKCSIRRSIVTAVRKDKNGAVEGKTVEDVRVVDGLFELKEITNYDAKDACIGHVFKRRMIGEKEWQLC